MRREWPQLLWPYKENGVPSLCRARMRAGVICNISHFFLDKSTLHRRLSRQDVFLFMQVDGCIAKYSKIAYLWVDVQFYKYSKIAYF